MKQEVSSKSQRYNATMHSRTAVVGTLTTSISRVLTIPIQILITGILSRSLSVEAFGLWMLLISLYNFAPNFDLGIGQAVRLQLSELHTRNTGSELEKNLFFGSLWGLVFIALCTFIIISVLIFNLGELRWINIHEPNLRIQLQTVLLVFAGAFCLSIITNLGNHIFFAYAESPIRGYLDIFQGLLLLTVIWVYQNATFTTMSIAYYSMITLIGALGLWTFLIRRGWRVKVPRLEMIRISLLKLTKSSLEFWLLSALSTIVFLIGPIMVNSFGTLEDVGNFSLLLRLFMMFIGVQASAIAPLQSAYTHAVTRNDWVWVKKTWQLSNLLTLVILGFGCSMMIIFYQPILKIWTGKTVQADELIIALAIWTITYAWINSNSVILNGLGIVQIQVKWLAVAAIINIILGSFLSQWFGVTGVPIATIVAILPMAILMPLSVKGVISTRGLQ